MEAQDTDVEACLGKVMMVRRELVHPITIDACETEWTTFEDGG